MCAALAARPALSRVFPANPGTALRAEPVALKSRPPWQYRVPGSIFLPLKTAQGRGACGGRRTWMRCQSHSGHLAATRASSEDGGQEEAPQVP